MTHHPLKVYTQFWDALASGARPFEVRRNDRGYKAGDTITFRRFDPTTGIMDERCGRVVTYVLAHEDFEVGLQRGFVVLGLEERGTDAEAQRLKARIEALYIYVALKYPDVPEILDEIRAIIEPANSEVDDGP